MIALLEIVAKSVSERILKIAQHLAKLEHGHVVTAWSDCDTVDCLQDSEGACRHNARPAAKLQVPFIIITSGARARYARA